MKKENLISKGFKKIFLLDNFDSFTFNLVDYFKQLGCEVFVYRNTVNPEMVKKIHPDLIVFSPGPSVPKIAGNMMKIIQRYHKKYPMFGVCLGHEAFIEYFGGSLKFVDPVHGKSSPIKHDGKTIFCELDQNFTAGRYHSLCADKVPDCFEISAETDGLVMAIRHKTLPIEGVQFHPESVLTMKRANGFKIIKNVVGKKFANLEKGQKKISLSKSQIEKFLTDSINGKVDVNAQVKFLENLAPEKITVEEMLIFVNFMRKKMTATLQMPNCMDICGTGGSGLNRINTSTIAAFILAELGVKIAKHGNKAASGRFGSFDLLENLGVEIEKTPEELQKLYKDFGLAFIFARSFHPVMKYFAEARKLIGKATIFNLIGPLLNPANPKIQIIGTSFKGQMKLLAEACKLLGKEKVLIVRGEDGLDEVTLTGKTDVIELIGGQIKEYAIEAKDFGISKCSFEEIAGGDGGVNQGIALGILNGEKMGRRRDLVLVNVALALRLAGKVENLVDAFKMAKKVCGIEMLRHYRKNILRDIAEEKRIARSDRNFYEAIKGVSRCDTKCEGGRHVGERHVEEGHVRFAHIAHILEVKKASPSEEEIFNGDFDPEKIAKIYEENGAAAISVLTDEKYFKGGFDNLKKIRAATCLPLICKDFVINEYQIYKAREFGADAILLIAALLTKEQIEKFLEIAESLGMSAIVEIHDEIELEKVLHTKAKIIGINNRDLKTFKVDLNTTNKLVKKIPEGRLIISESGLNSKSDIDRLDSRVNAVLIGTAAVKALSKGKSLKNIF